MNSRGVCFRSGDLGQRAIMYYDEPAGIILIIIAENSLNKSDSCKVTVVIQSVKSSDQDPLLDDTRQLHCLSLCGDLLTD